MKSLKLSKRMEQAVELMKQEEFYLCELPNWSFWGAYNLPGQTIRTDTMKALEHRGLVKIELAIGISIHSTTRVETAILHNNHYYSSTHFHKQIISHPLKSRPTIPAHSQIRSHCANFPVRISP